MPKTREEYEMQLDELTKSSSHTMEQKQYILMMAMFEVLLDIRDQHEGTK